MKISECRNLCPKIEEQFEAIGITNFKQLEELGWEEVALRFNEYYPGLINLNLVAAVIGAIYDQDWRKIYPQLKKQAKLFLTDIKKAHHK